MDNNIKKIVKKNLLEYADLEEQRFAKLGKALKTLAKKGGEYIDRFTAPARQSTARAFMSKLPKLSDILGENTERLILVIGDDAANKLEKALKNNDNFLQTSAGVLTHIRLKNPNTGQVKNYSKGVFKKYLEQLANKQISIDDFINLAGEYTHWNDGQSLRSLFKPNMLKSSVKEIWSGFWSMKAMGLIVRTGWRNSFTRLIGKYKSETHGLSSGEKQIIVTYLLTGVGNYAKIAQLLKIRGAKGIIPALFNLGGQFLQRYVILYLFYSVPGVYDYIADAFWRKGKQYPTDREGFSARFVNFIDFVSYAPKALVSPLYQGIYEILDHMDGEDVIDEKSKSKFFSYIKREKEKAEGIIAKEVQKIENIKEKVKKVIPKKITPNNTTPVDTNTSAPNF